MEIENLRKELRELLVQDPEAAFAKLKTLLPTVSSRHKDLMMLEARWEDLEREVTKGVIAPNDADLKRNKILEGLIDTIGDLKESDFQTAASTSNGLPKAAWLALAGLASMLLIAVMFFLPKKKGSSSANMMPGTEAVNAPNTFTDPRDGQQYRTIRLAGRTWMAENLRYRSPKSLCYENDSLSCADLGRLYYPNEAETACPSGWHLPSFAEWKDLAMNEGGYLLNIKTPPDEKGNAMQALTSLSVGGNSGFDAVAAGYFDAHNFDGKDKFGGYWTSSTAYREYVMSVVFDTWRDKQLIFEGREQSWMLSCRCVRN